MNPNTEERQRAEAEQQTPWYIALSRRIAVNVLSIKTVR